MVDYQLLVKDSAPRSFLGSYLMNGLVTNLIGSVDKVATNRVTCHDPFSFCPATSKMFRNETWYMVYDPISISLPFQAKLKQNNNISLISSIFLQKWSEGWILSPWIVRLCILSTSIKTQEGSNWNMLLEEKKTTSKELKRRQRR